MTFKKIAGEAVVIRKYRQFTKWLLNNDPALKMWYDWMSTHKKRPDDEVMFERLGKNKKAVFVLQDWLLVKK